MIAPTPRAGSESPTSGAASGVIESPVSILIILATINFLNYADRQVMAPLVSLVELPKSLGGLGLTDTESGLLQTAFMVVHAVTSIPLGVLADRLLRKRLIAVGVGVWSLATAGAGFARSFLQLFGARAAVGIGEATYAPAASALISERFRPESRARALGVFQLGMVMGGAAGVVMGSLVGSRWGWRAAFFVVGAPGLVLAALAWIIKEAPRAAPARAVTDAPPGSSLAIDVQHMLRSPAVVWINLAGILITFFTGAFIFWLPHFILRYHYGGDTSHLEEVGATFGLLATVAGASGTIVGSLVADRVEKRRPGEGRLLVVAFGVFASVPFATLGFLSSSLPLVYVALALGVFFNVWYVGPILAALHDVVPSRYRGTATGVYLLAVHLLGDAFSPTIVGAVSQHTHSLKLGLGVAVVLLVTGGLAALAAVPHARKRKMG